MSEPPEEGGYRGLPLLVAEDGAVQADYHFAKVQFVAEGEEKWVAVVLIAVVQGRVLAALPAQVWNRVTARRLLPPKALVKPFLVEVVAAQADKPELPLEEEPIKVWMGFLDRRLAETAVALAPEDEVHYDLRFADVTSGEERIPFGQAMADVAEDHYVFQSAAEGVEPPGGGGVPDVEHRMAMMEESMLSIQASLNALAGQTATPTGGVQLEAAKSSPAVAVPLPRRPSALKKPKEASKEKDPMSLMDPTVVQSARQAGIPEGQLNALARLLGKTNRMADQPGGSKAAPRGMELSESEDDAEDEDPEGLEGGASAPAGRVDGATGNPIEKAVVQLTKIVGRMSRRPGRDLEALLDGADGGTGEAGLGSSAGKSKAAAYKRLKAALTDNPAYIYETVEGLMETDFMQAKTGPGATNLATSSRGWVEHRSKIAHYPSSIRAIWALAAIHDCLKVGAYQEARARAALAVAAWDQSSLEVESAEAEKGAPKIHGAVLEATFNSKDKGKRRREAEGEMASASPVEAEEVKEPEEVVGEDKAKDENEDEESSSKKEGPEKAQRPSLPQKVIEELLKFPRSQFVYSESFGDLEAALASGPGLLDLFAGSRGLSKACCRGAPTWSLTFDISHSPSEDLLVSSLQAKLTKLVRAGAFFAMVAGPVCSSFSSAITPPTRTLLHPEGVPWASGLQSYKNDQGNRMLAFTLRMVRVCIACSIFFVVENPDSSWMWRQKRDDLKWDDVFETDPYAGDLRLDFCRFGTRWRKRTRFRCNLNVAGQRILCACQEPHLVLRGRCKAKGVNYTKLAEPYPRKLCGALAAAILSSAGFFGERRVLDLASCAKVTNKRIGEANHPGPRRNTYRPHRGSIDLSSVELLEPATIKIRAKVWDRFISWTNGEVGAGVAEQWLSSCPPLFVQLLVAFGYALFHGGESLHLFRQFLAHVQREHPALRLHLSTAWMVVTKWEKVEPTVHRTPIPEALLKAMISLAWCWKWRRFAAVLAFTFYSVSRVGEVLRATRAHVLTPRDLLFETNTVYLRILRPKTRNRGAKTQYCSTEVDFCVRLVASVWDELSPDQMIYGGSASAFRSRWDAILRKLNINSSIHLTPGSLRGGGAIAAYRRGVPIEQLMWMMRVLHQRTLGFYLQEMVAASVLPSLPGNVLAHIRLLQCLLPFLIGNVPAAP